VKRLILAALVVAIAVPLANAGAQAVGLLDSSDVRNNSLRSADLKNNAAVRSRDVVDGSLRCKDFDKRTREAFCTNEPGPQGAPGPTGGRGDAGPAGPPGDDGRTAVTSLPSEGFDATNSSVGVTPDGLAFGPYADGGAAGGSLFYSGLNGMTLADVESLVYKARYESNGDTGGVGAPYLRIFLEGDSHDAIFAPNSQMPDPDIGEGAFHTWAATSGLWRYDDDAGLGGPGTYGVNGAPFSTLVADHGSEVISGIYITTGFTAGSDLKALLREFEINGERFVFGG
jgi:hypothetical protein